MNSDGMSYLFAIMLLIAAFLVLMTIFAERHFMLRYIFILAIFVGAYFIPTAIYQIPIHCTTEIANSTVTGSTTTYEYREECFTSNTTLPDTFYRVYAWIYFICIMYFIIKIFYDLYQHYLKGKSWSTWESWFR